MAEAQQKTKLSCLEILICGKVVGVEQIQGKNNNLFYSNTIVMPAVDTFSRPTRVVLNSKLPFAQEGDMVETTAYVQPRWRQNDGKWFFNCNLWRDKPEF